MTASIPLAGSLSLGLDQCDPISSPDPLATSLNDENSFPTSSLVKGATQSQRKHRSTKILEDITLSSPEKVRRRPGKPSKSLIPPRSERLPSPWKIRVTVEAEPDEAGFSKMGSISKAIMVPPNHPPSPTKVIGGQGRSNSGLRKLGGKRRTSSTSVSHCQQDGVDARRLTDLDTGFLDDDNMTRIKPKRKPQTRKSIKARGNDNISADEGTLPSMDKSAEGTDVPQPFKNNNDHDTVVEDNMDSECTIWHAKGSAELRELDSNRMSVRSRGALLRTANVPMAEESLRNNEKPSIAALSAARPPAAIDQRERHVSAASALTYPTPDASDQDELEAHALQSDATVEHAGSDTILESEGFTMIDLESLPSARNFVTSPDICEHLQKQPLSHNERRASVEQPRSVPDPVCAPASPINLRSSPTNLVEANKPSLKSYLAPPEEGESDLSSTVPSTPRIESTQQILSSRSHSLSRSPPYRAQTPLPAAGPSPKLPSSPNPSQRAEDVVAHKVTKSTPPRLVCVVRAGNALQGLLSPDVKTPFLALSPAPATTSTGQCSASVPKEKPDDLFIGFDSGTRRELRAGLRFGEELAKRQRLSYPESCSSRDGAMPVLNREDRGHNNVACRDRALNKGTPSCRDDPQAEEANSSTENDGPASQDALETHKPAAPSNADQSCESIVFLDAEARERRWRLERETISKQIEDANTSQVIVIDSEDEEEEKEKRAQAATLQSPAKSVISEAEEDIWLAEAGDSQSSSRHTEEDLFPRAEQLRQRERARDVISRPRRGLIPSPWKRGEDVGSTFMSNDDASGMFWQQTRRNEGPNFLPRPMTDTNLGETKKQGIGPQKMISRLLAQEERTWDTSEGGTCQSLEDTSEHGTQEQYLSRNHADIFGHGNHLVSENVFAANADLAASSDVADEANEEPSTSPQPVKVSVNFDKFPDRRIQSGSWTLDKTHFESPSASPCRPATPRSAMKGSRALIDIDNQPAFQTPRKVAFGRHSTCLDDTGMETSMAVRGDSLSSEPSITSSDLHASCAKTSLVKTDINGDGIKNGQRTEDNPRLVPVQPATISWFSSLTGWGAKPSSDRREANRHGAICLSKPGHPESGIQWQPTTTVFCATKVEPFHRLSTSSGPRSDASDSRIPPPPEALPTSGSFSDDHYKHLHILYLKSLKSSFTRPGSVRPALKAYVGQKFYSGDGEFAWEVTTRDAEVVERWIRSFEGRDARTCVRDWNSIGRNHREVGWDEWDLCKRLFSIVSGQELRREDKMRKERQVGEYQG